MWRRRRQSRFALILPLCLLLSCAKQAEQKVDQVKETKSSDRAMAKNDAKGILEDHIRKQDNDMIKKWVDGKDVKTIDYIVDSGRYDSDKEYGFIVCINNNDKRLLYIAVNRATGMIDRMKSYNSVLSRKDAREKALKMFEEKTNEYIRKHGPVDSKNVIIEEVGINILESMSWIVGLKVKGDEAEWSVSFKEDGSIDEVVRGKP